ncbi:LysR family transcriptional regulator [Polaromonas sp.]|uniref:LysR family transcriptional regulator n=1 Tax=Polaromonas sp. TaxID=1869339 RepID=UPI00374FFE9F
MDKLKAMHTFVQIADHGSLTAAAGVLGSSLPAVVRALAGLELQLGVRLFNRTTRRISLTEEGRHYLDRCRHVLAAVDDAESVLTREAAEPRGLLSITAPVLFGQMHVAPAVTRFVQKYDGMHCRMLLLDRVVNLLEEGIDVGIRIGELDDSTLVAQPVGRIRRLVVASPAWLRLHGVPKHPRDLLKANCVRVTDQGPTWGPFNDQGRQLRLAINGNLEFNQIAPAVAACVAGIGPGSFFSYQVAPFLKSKALRTVLEDFEPPSQPINLVYPHARMLPMRARIFIDWTRHALREFRP